MILVLGKNGQLSQEFQKINKNKTLYLSSKDLDLTESNLITPTLEKTDPSLIINFTAFNAVDLAEEDPKNILINSLALKKIALFSRNKEIPLIHVSTDYVFDGTKGRYTEKDIPNPINKYGKAKLDGEKYIQSICNKFFIIRTSWLYSIHGKNFLTKIIKMYKSEPNLVGAYDLIGSPTSAKSLARAILYLIESIKRNEEKYGLFHFSNKGEISKYDFIKKIISELDVKSSSSNFLIKKVKNEYFNLAAPRPYNTSLESNKFSKKFNFQVPNWEDELQLVMDEL